MASDLVIERIQHAEFLTERRHQLHESLRPGNRHRLRIEPGLDSHDRSNQRGIHARFEALMFERFVKQLKLSPKPIQPIRAPLQFTFDALLEGTTLVPTVLDADRMAIGDRDVYDAAYYDAFFRGSRAVLERRLDESTAAVAAMIAGAWEAAGKPDVPVRARDTDQRRRR